MKVKNVFTKVKYTDGVMSIVFNYANGLLENIHIERGIEGLPTETLHLFKIEHIASLMKALQEAVEDGAVPG